MKALPALFALAALCACQPAAQTDPVANDEAAASSEVVAQGDPAAPDIGADNCIAELARVASRDSSEISIIDVDPSAGPVTYRLALADAAAPWICITDPAARVTELYYDGEG